MKIQLTTTTRRKVRELKPGTIFQSPERRIYMIIKNTSWSPIQVSSDMLPVINLPEFETNAYRAYAEVEVIGQLTVEDE